MDKKVQENLKDIINIYSCKANSVLGSNWHKDFERSKNKQAFLLEIAKRDYEYKVLQYAVEWLVLGIPIDHIELVLSKKLKEPRLFKIDKIFNESNKMISKNLTKAQLKLLLKDSFDEYSMDVIYKWFLEGDSAKEAKKYLVNGMDVYQSAQIRAGYKEGLTKEQIAIYSKTEYASSSMKIIRKAIINKIPENKLKLLLDPAFIHVQLEEIYLGLFNGLSINKVKVYADVRFSWMEMKEIRKAFEEGLTIKQVKRYAKPAYDSNQMKQIRKGIKSLGLEKVSIYLNPAYDVYKMKEIHYMLQVGYTHEELKPYLHLDYDHIKWVFSLIARNIPKIDVILSSDFAISQKEAIMEGLHAGYISDKETKLYINPKLDPGQIRRIISALGKFSANKVKVVANPKLNNSQIDAIINAFEKGVLVKYVKLYAKKEFDAHQMREITDSLIVLKERFVPYINSEYADGTFRYICYALMEDFTESEINEIIQEGASYWPIARDKYQEIIKRRDKASVEYKRYIVQQTLLNYAEEK